MTQFKEEKTKEETPVLLHRPLIEVIFELRWEIQADEQNQRMKDPSYPMMYGSLYERLKKELPIAEDLPSTQAHPEATPFIPRHRMRKSKDSYPLVQMGPGILTVNSSKDYGWSDYSALILKIVSFLEELFPEEIMPLNFIKAELRYVNGIKFDLARENPLGFLADKLHMKVEMDPELFEKNLLNERPNSLGLNISYALEKPLGNLAITANLGQFDGRPAFIQQTLIQSFGELAPGDQHGFIQWLDEAHKAAENTFRVLTKGQLMERFLGA